MMKIGSEWVSASCAMSVPTTLTAPNQVSPEASRTSGLSALAGLKVYGYLRRAQ